MSYRVVNGALKPVACLYVTEKRGCVNAIRYGNIKLGLVTHIAHGELLLALSGGDIVGYHTCDEIYLLALAVLIMHGELTAACGKVLTAGVKGLYGCGAYLDTVDLLALCIQLILIVSLIGHVYGADAHCVPCPYGEISHTLGYCVYLTLFIYSDNAVVIYRVLYLAGGVDLCVIALNEICGGGRILLIEADYLYGVLAVG